MVRYYGFLSNRKRGWLLPLVYLALGEKSPKQAEPLTYVKQYNGFTGNNPYQCVLCGSRMVFTGFTAGKKTRATGESPNEHARITASWCASLG